MPVNFAEELAQRLSPHLGPNMARKAVLLFAQRSLLKKPDELTRLDAPKLVEALHPMLRTLVGEGLAQQLVGEMLAQVNS